MDITLKLMKMGYLTFLSKNCEKELADTTKLFRTILLLGGDISTNPGPIRFPCVECKRHVARNQRGIECDSCELWIHAKCIEMSTSKHESLTEDRIRLCSKCLPTTEPIDVLSDCSETEDDGDDGTVKEVEELARVKPNNPKSQHGDQRKQTQTTKIKLKQKLTYHNLLSEMK